MMGIRLGGHWIFASGLLFSSVAFKCCVRDVKLLHAAPTQDNWAVFRSYRQGEDC